MTRVDAVSCLLRARDDLARRGQSSLAERVAAEAVRDLIDYADSALHYVNQCVSRDKALHAANGAPRSEPISAAVAAGLSNALERLGVDTEKGTSRIWRVFQIEADHDTWFDVTAEVYGDHDGSRKRIVTVVEESCP